MKTIQISLSTIESVRQFVNIVNTYNFDMDLVSGRYVVDAKSIMGIFSLDLLRPNTLNIHCEECDKLLEELKPFIV